MIVGSSNENAEIDNDDAAAEVCVVIWVQLSYCAGLGWKYDTINM